MALILIDVNFKYSTNSPSSPFLLFLKGVGTEISNLKEHIHTKSEKFFQVLQWLELTLDLHGFNHSSPILDTPRCKARDRGLFFLESRNPLRAHFEICLLTGENRYITGFGASMYIVLSCKQINLSLLISCKNRGKN